MARSDSALKRLMLEDVQEQFEQWRRRRAEPIHGRMRGDSQRELAAEPGIAQRMIAYYEKQTEHPPTHLLPLLAKTLGVSADELLGLEKPKPVCRTSDTRLWRRFSVCFR